MEKEITDKLESLLKYIPFINFILKVDKQKYVKFIDIRKWIINKKRYPLSYLIKMEQSIITQYKNLLLVDDKIPREIMNIFNSEVQHQFVDLCSDDEEDHTGLAQDKSRKRDNKLNKLEETEAKLNNIVHKAAKKSSHKKKSKNDKRHRKSSSLKKKKHDKQTDDSEDDLEFVSILYINKVKDEEQDESKKQTTSKTKCCDKNILNLDDVSEEMLRKIDVLNKDDNKNSNFHEPINYHKHSDDEGSYEVKQENLYQRRKSEDALFKRRDDFKDLHFNVEAKQHTKPKCLKNKQNSGQIKSPTTILETISLDSSSASESEESFSNVPTTLAKSLAALNSVKLRTNTPNASTSFANNIGDDDLNRKTYITANREYNPQTMQSEKLNIATDTTEAVDRVVLSSTASSLDVSLLNDSKSKRNIDCKTNSNHCFNDDSSSKSLLDMDIDTENDLNDVLNEINNPGDSNLKTNDIICDTSNFRNSSPPLATEAIESESTISNKENVTTSTDFLTSVFDNKNLRNLSQEQICKIFEDIESKSDIEIDELLQTLSNILEITTPTCANNVNANILAETLVSTEVTNVQNDLTPPAPHFNPTAPCPQLQHPNFYSNPLMPPFIPSPHIYHHPNQQYLQQQVVPPPHQYNVAPNFIPTPMPGMESFSRINLKDPRIIRKLQLIQDSPLLNEFNRNNAEILRNALCRKQWQQHFTLPTFQQQYPQPVTNKPATSGGTPAPISNRRKSTTKSTINFGEYKRRQIEQQQELERKREEEKKQKEDALKAKKVEEIKKIEKRELLRSTDDIRSILLSTLEPYKDELNTMWGQHCNTPISTTQQRKNDDVSNKEAIETVNNSKLNSTKETNVCHSQRENKNINSCAKKLQEKSNVRINRVYKELECTLKGFDQIQDYIPKSIGGKRRSSVHARSTISEQLNSYLSDDCSDQSDINNSRPKSIGYKRKSSVHSDTNDINSSQSIDNSDVPKPVGCRRRSSINARLAIIEQINILQQPTDYLDSSDVNSSQSQSCIEMPKLVVAKRRSCTLARSAISEQLQQQTLNDYSDSSDINSSQSTSNERQNSCTAKRRKTIEEPIQAKKRNKTFIIRDESSLSDSSPDEGDFDKFRLAKLQRLKEYIIKNPPTVVLERISQDFIRKHTKSAAVLPIQNVLNVHLVESKIRPSKIDRIEKPPSQKVAKPKKCNNDSQMTERNTKFCALCTSKPSDLTNHYKRKHKTESYVARLTWSQLEDLAFNTPFAKLQPKSLNSHIDRYQVDCPFCDQHLLEPFISLYNHYSTHTGEYAYRCSHCQLDRPYRADIQSHQLHSKTCRNNSTQVLYRYPPNVQCIYLYYCTICNFVQLNEANILKHLREHHDPRKAVAQNVQKCILAAISDAPDVTDKQLEEVQSQNGDQDKLNIVEENNTQKIIATSLRTAKKTETGFKVDDDDIPVSNEACVQDLFEGKFSLEEQLKQMHEEPATNITPMTVIHCGKSTANINQTITPKSNANMIPLSPPATKTYTLQKVLPMIIKAEAMDVAENLLITPPSPSSLLLGANNSLKHEATSKISQESFTLKNYPNTVIVSSSSKDNLGISPLSTSYQIYEKYHNYPENVNYLGLYKCMADDCYYSTDSSDEISKHLDDHSQDSSPSEYLQCPYCIISANEQITPLQLIEHIRLKHQHMIYQCSVCCYRSCEASNVLVHQKHSHLTSLNAIVYKCAGTEINFNEKESYIKDKILENVRKIKCPCCRNASFYNSNLIVQHLLNQHHKIHSSDLKIYSCIYCPFTERDQDSIQKHLSTQHPYELPYIYDHNNKVETAQDPLINNSNILSISQPVSYLDVNSISNSGEEVLVNDVKPELNELIKMNEDTVMVRLRKLTAHTGVPPDSLYRCPEPSCGGFFTVFELWLRHMRIRHHCLECQCPHCPPQEKNKTNEYPASRTLESYAGHFEKHRRHTFICFYCATTSRNEDLAKQHAAEHHSNFGEMRLEQIRINVNYSYFIMIQNGLFTERVEFISEFLSVLDKRLMDMESIEVQNLKHQWLIQPNALWLENLPKINNNRRLVIKCLDDTCKFRSIDDEVLFQHMNTNHDPYRVQFKCKKCDNKILCNDWNDIFEHRKLHSNDSVFICVACLQTNENRSKLAEHIRDQHAARDVPVIEHIRTREKKTFIKLAVIFANNHLTFSTIRNCFCCDEKNMNGDAFVLHLRRYHRLTLNYFCEWCINTQFKSLEEVKSHFQSFHPTARTKIRCELAFNGEIFVTSLDVFQLQIVKEDQKMVMIEVKKEPNDQPDYDNDDDVVILENDDIVIQESLKNHELAGEGEKPKLKCVSLNNLLQAQCAMQTPQPSSNSYFKQVVPHKLIGQTPSGTQSATPALNSLTNYSIVDNQKQFVTTTVYTHFNSGISIINNKNLPLSTSAVSNNNNSRSQTNVRSNASNTNNSTFTLNNHSNLQPGSSATSSYTINTQNIANASSQNYVLPNATNTHDNTINNQNVGDVSCQNYVLTSATNTFSNTLNNSTSSKTLNNQNYARIIPSFVNQNNVRRYNEQSCIRRIIGIDRLNYNTPSADTGSYVGAGVQNHNMSLPVLSTYNSTVPPQTSTTTIQKQLQP